MEKSRESGFLFCNMCGTMLILKSTKYAECPLCKTTRNAKEIVDKKIAYTVTAEDIRRELGLSLFGEKAQEESELPKIKKACEKCQHPELVYTTRQTRSADEGQTTYYTCPNCLHRYSQKVEIIIISSMKLDSQRRPVLFLTSILQIFIVIIRTICIVSYIVVDYNRSSIFDHHSETFLLLIVLETEHA